MKTMTTVLVAILLSIAGSLWADPAVKIIDEGHLFCDADGEIWLDEDATFTIIYNDGDPTFVGVAGKGQLPEGAALPEKAYSYSAQDCGFCGCWMCDDESKFTVTPKGRVNFWCRMHSE